MKDVGQIRIKRTYIKGSVVLLLMAFIGYFWTILFFPEDLVGRGFSLRPAEKYGVMFYSLFSILSLFILYSKSLGKFTKKRYRAVLVLDYLALLSPIIAIIKYPLTGFDNLTILPGMLMFMVFNAITLNTVLPKKFSLIKLFSTILLLLFVFLVYFITLI